ncbi:hypothetical protein ACFPRL_01375 [Pseudoclavibacter helvolus]
MNSSTRPFTPAKNLRPAGVELTRWASANPAAMPPMMLSAVRMRSPKTG